MYRLRLYLKVYLYRQEMIQEEDYNQIDSIGYLVDEWLKFPKQGYTIATAMSARLIRYGMMTRDEAVDIIIEEDPKLDDKVLDDFLLCTGYSHNEFMKILDKKYWNPEIFDNIDGLWVMKDECKIKKLGH